MYSRVMLRPWSLLCAALAITGCLGAAVPTTSPTTRVQSDPGFAGDLSIPEGNSSYFFLADAAETSDVEFEVSAVDGTGSLLVVTLFTIEDSVLSWSATTFPENLTGTASVGDTGDLFLLVLAATAERPFDISITADDGIGLRLLTSGTAAISRFREWTSLDVPPVRVRSQIGFEVVESERPTPLFPWAGHLSVKGAHDLDGETLDLAFVGLAPNAGGGIASVRYTFNGTDFDQTYPISDAYRATDVGVMLGDGHAALDFEMDGADAFSDTSLTLVSVPFRPAAFGLSLLPRPPAGTLPTAPE